MLLQINSDNPEGRKIRQVAETLQSGGIVIYPTDTVYAIGCDIDDHKAFERICRLRRLDPNKATLSFICRDISQVASYAAQIDNETFRLIHRNLPGPFTFLLRSGHHMPRHLKNRKKTFGFRIPNNPIAQAIVDEMGRPLLSASLRLDDQVREYETDPSLIHDDYQKLVDLVIDGGPGGQIASTVVDCTDDEPLIIRQGVGELRP